MFVVHVIKLSRETNSFQDFSNRPILCRTVSDYSKTKASPFTAIKYFFMLRYYKFDTEVKSDYELQAYINEVSIYGTGENGGIGRVNIKTENMI